MGDLFWYVVFFAEYLLNVYETCLVFFYDKSAQLFDYLLVFWVLYNEQTFVFFTSSV